MIKKYFGSLLLISVASTETFDLFNGRGGPTPETK